MSEGIRPTTEHQDHLDPTRRFSARVADYVKYRPGYPQQVIPLLTRVVGFSLQWIVADIGCGTGISSRLFVDHGNQVIGVEPNEPMRAAALELLGGGERFTAVAGSGEATGLPDASADLVVVAQAFHWLDKAAAAAEMIRILKPGGAVLVMWNERSTTADAFAAEYDQLLRARGTDYTRVVTRRPMSVTDFESLFGCTFQRFALPNEQVFDFDGLAGRVRSSSYTPLPGAPGHDLLFADLRRLFDRHQRDGRVRFEYETELFVGNFGKSQPTVLR
jgi:SAM-dependent methyltransferase